MSRGRRNKPTFAGFGLLASNPVLVGMQRDLAVQVQASHKGEVRVHEVPVVAVSPKIDVGTYREYPLGEAIPNPPASFPRGAGGWTASGASPTSRGAVTSHGGRGAFGGHGRGYGGGGYFPWWQFYPYWSPYFYTYGSWGPNWRPGLPTPGECEPPLSDDCTRFQVTRRWAIVCFMAAYNRLRPMNSKLDALVDAIVRAEAPQCNGNTSSAREFRRRVRLAVAFLQRQEGVNVPLPPPPGTTRPPGADTYRQPWVRALMTGWL